ncbi:hypothetical protein D9M71_503230 [compost metagenome]
MSSITRTPLRVICATVRPLTGCTLFSPWTMPSSASPKACAAAAAARAFCTLCVPSRFNCTRPTPAGPCRSNAGQPRASRLRLAAWKSAMGLSRAKLRTPCCSARAFQMGNALSSRLRMAIPPSPNPSRISPLASTIFSGPPNSPTCAVPALLITTTCGWVRPTV